MPLPQPAAPDPIEQQYDELRTDVQAPLVATFGDAVDRDEIYQEAWTELLEYRARGREVRDTLGMLRTIAWRRARDRLRARRAAPMDPHGPALANLAGIAPPTDEAAQVHVD